MDLAKKKIKSRLIFSTEGLQEIIDFHKMVLENFELGISAFASSDRELAEKLLQRKITIASKERRLRAAHIKRLHKGLRETIDTSAIHLDILTNLKRINSYISNIAYPLIAEKDQNDTGV
jgi:phosphate:Na+ symporter